MSYFIRYLVQTCAFFWIIRLLFPYRVNFKDYVYMLLFGIFAHVVFSPLIGVASHILSGIGFCFYLCYLANKKVENYIATLLTLNLLILNHSFWLGIASIIVDTTLNTQSLLVHLLITLWAAFFIVIVFYKTKDFIILMVNSIYVEFEKTIEKRLLSQSVLFFSLVWLIHIKHYNNLYLWFAIAMMLLISIILLGMSMHQIMKKSREKDMAFLLQLSEENAKKYTYLRRFRHDYINLIQSLELAIQEENIGKVKDIYTHLIQPTKKYVEVKEIDLAKIDQIKILEIKSLLYQKTKIALSQSITVQLEIECQLDQISMPLLDFYRVLSILLDNAIESAVLTEEKLLNITIVELEHSFLFEIENSCNVVPENLNLLFKDGWSSKGWGRGTGLATVMSIMDSQPYGTLSTRIEHGTRFIQMLKLLKE